MRLRTAPLAASLLAGVVLLAGGCRTTRDREARAPGSGDGLSPLGPPGELSLNRGGWLMGSQDKVWLVLEENAAGGPPKRIGYVTSRRYREVRGGPEFTMYEVTSLDRKEVVGMVDSLGNATRFRWRYGGVDQEKMGNNTLPLGVQAIFGTVRPISLRETSERDLAFEMLDKNSDGLLDAAEFPRIADRVGSPDRDRNGKVDRQEFEDADL
jgi:hypothetical protein